MKLSWSHKLFFWTNRWVGRWPAYDAWVKFWAESAVFLLSLVVLAQYLRVSQNWADLARLFVVTGGLLGTGLGLSYLIAWLWPHPRPKNEFPEIKEAITPLSHWKSLPSDHSLIAWLLAVSCVYFTSPGIIISGLVCTMATSIACARVLAGVHYPRDVIAGSVLAGVIVYLYSLL